MKQPDPINQAVILAGRFKLSCGAINREQNWPIRGHRCLLNAWPGGRHDLVPEMGVLAGSFVNLGTAHTLINLY
jgi:hypothetical protein